MLHRFWEKGRKGVAAALAAVLVAAVAVVMQPGRAEAHCDSVSGPVVAAAKAALDKGDVTQILPYIQAPDEAELTAAFQHTLAVRKLGGEAKDLAETYFFETAVRLHRKGEGAAYTGLKYDTDYGPALEAAEAALETGELAPTLRVLNDTFRMQLAQRWQAVIDARAKAAHEGTVEAERERVEAELGFELYVHSAWQAALGGTTHSEAAGEAGGHQHGSSAQPE